MLGTVFTTTNLGNVTLLQNAISPMHVAAKWGQLQMLTLLLEKEAQINIQTRDGLTPLHCAARSGYVRVVDFLLENHADHSSKTRVCLMLAFLSVKYYEPWTQLVNTFLARWFLIAIS